jgi:hypothetical protein
MIRNRSGPETSTAVEGGTRKADELGSSIASENNVSADAVKVDRFVSKLMKLDRDLARTLYELLWQGRAPVSHDLMLRLRDALGRDDDSDIDAAASARARLFVAELFDDLFFGLPGNAGVRR